MAVRLRPHNVEELVADADFADCVELQPEVLCCYLTVGYAGNTILSDLNFVRCLYLLSFICLILKYK